MKTILIIGIGVGNPDYVTIQAINALNRVDVFFVLDKGADKEQLAALRREICRRYIKEGHPHRFVEAASPDHDYPTHAAGAAEYRASVEDLNRDKRALFDRLIAEEMTDGECGAFLVWGDPTLYDSTLRIVAAIAAGGGHALEYEVIPGISSVQALAARHRTTLNRLGDSIMVTTGRKMAAEGFPNNLDSVVVMLDAENVYRRFADHDIDIYWGAYVGTPDEILLSGKLRDVMDEIERVREESRRAHGWIMDSYLLRRN